MLEIPRRYHQDAVVEDFTFRLSRPAFAGATVVTRGTPDPDDPRRIVVAGSPAGLAVASIEVGDDRGAVDGGSTLQCGVGSMVVVAVQESGERCGSFVVG